MSVHGGSPIIPSPPVAAVGAEGPFRNRRDACAAGGAGTKRAQGVAAAAPPTDRRTAPTRYKPPHGLAPPPRLAGIRQQWKLIAVRPGNASSTLFGQWGGGRMEPPVREGGLGYQSAQNAIFKTSLTSPAH